MIYMKRNFAHNQVQLLDSFVDFAPKSSEARSDHLIFALFSVKFSSGEVLSFVEQEY